MQRTVKLKWDRNHLYARLVSVECCNERKWFFPDDLQPCYMWHCLKCEKLILVVDGEGNPYVIGERIWGEDDANGGEVD